MLTLPDGRTLDYTLTGPDGGTVLAFHHGTPGGSVQLASLQEAAAARGLRLLTWARAGYGESSRRPGRDVASEVDDVVALLDHVGADQCLVAGWSGGGPHALACGALIPDRVRAVLCISGVAPYDADGLDFLAGMGQDNLDEFDAALRGEPELRAWMAPQCEALATITPGDIAAQLDSILPPVDKAVLTGDFAEYLAHGFHEAVRHGPDGWIDDDLAFTAPWGFDLAAIAVPTIVWQGSEDLMVPFAHGQWLAAHVPGVTAHLEQGEGHVSIGVGAMDAMLDELVRHR